MTFQLIQCCLGGVLLGDMLALTAWMIHKPSTLRIARKCVGLTVIEGFWIEVIPTGEIEQISNRAWLRKEIHQLFGLDRNY